MCLLISRRFIHWLPIPRKIFIRIYVLIFVRFIAKLSVAPLGDQWRIPEFLKRPSMIFISSFNKCVRILKHRVNRNQLKTVHIISCRQIKECCVLSDSFSKTWFVVRKLIQNPFSTHPQNQSLQINAPTFARSLLPFGEQ